MLIAPVQPSIARAVAGNPAVDLLVPVSLTVPALMIGLLAPVAGRFVDKTGRIRLLTGALGAAGAGIAVMGLATTVPPMAVGAVLASAGTGLLLPTLLTWAVGSLPDEQRGRGAGAWTGCLFIGQFLCPVFILAVGGLLGGLSAALVVMAVIAMALRAQVLVARPVTPEALVD